MKYKNKFNSRDEYLLMQFNSTKTEPFNQLETVGEFSIGQIVRVRVDWINLSRYKARIKSFGKYGNKIFANLQWIGAGRDLYDIAGNLFNIDELTRI